jgi:hypothetical protein
MLKMLSHVPSEVLIPLDEIAEATADDAGSLASYAVATSSGNINGITFSQDFTSQSIRISGRLHSLHGRMSGMPKHTPLSEVPTAPNRRGEVDRGACEAHDQRTNPVRGGEPHAREV